MSVGWTWMHVRCRRSCLQATCSNGRQESRRAGASSVRRASTATCNRRRPISPSSPYASTHRCHPRRHARHRCRRPELRPTRRRPQGRLLRRRRQSRRRQRHRRRHPPRHPLPLRRPRQLQPTSPHAVLTVGAWASRGTLRPRRPACPGCCRTRSPSSWWTTRTRGSTSRGQSARCSPPAPPMYERCRRQISSSTASTRARRTRCACRPSTLWAGAIGADRCAGARRRHRRCPVRPSRRRS